MYDPVRDRMMVHGGYSGVFSSEVWALSWNPLLSAPDPTRPSFRLSPLRPNPTRGAVTLELQLDDRTPVTLEVFDVGGRNVTTLARGPLAPGSHRWTWSGRERSGTRVAAGVYLIRMTTPHASETRRAILLP